MNVLITGSCGYIGSCLTKRILDEFSDVRIKAVDNLLYNQTGLVPLMGDPRLEFVYGDARNKELMKPLYEWADYIIPLAAVVGAAACDRDQDYSTEINSDHPKFLSKFGKKVIFPNSNSGYGVGGSEHCTEESPLNPISHYGRTKCLGEDHVINGGGISLRLATVFGVSPRMRLDLLVNNFVLKAVTDGYVVLFEKYFRRNFVHVQDVCSAFIHMMRNYDSHRGQVFNCGLTSANMTKEQLCNKIKDQVPKFVVVETNIGSDPDKRDYVVSNEKLEKTGWEPKHSLESGIAELIKAYKILLNSDRKHSNY